MLLVIAASPREYTGLVKRSEAVSPAVRWLATTRIGGSKAVLVANGAGRAAASGATRALLEQGGAHAVVSTGFAGALDPSLEVGDIFVAESVLDNGQTHPALPPMSCPPGARRGTLITVDEVVVSSRSKQDLRLASGAQAVDMEAAGVASEAARYGVDFYCIRSISDTATLDLPVDFNRAMRSDGTLSAVDIVLQARISLRRWAGLGRLWSDARLASRNLGRYMSSCEFRH